MVQPAGRWLVRASRTGAASFSVGLRRLFVILFPDLEGQHRVQRGLARAGRVACDGQRNNGDACSRYQKVFHQPTAGLAHMPHRSLSRVQRYVGQRHGSSNSSRRPCRLASMGRQCGTRNTGT